MELKLGSGGNLDNLVWVNIIGNKSIVYESKIKCNQIANAFKFSKFPPLPLKITPLKKPASELQLNMGMSYEVGKFPALRTGSR